MQRRTICIASPPHGQRKAGRGLSQACSGLGAILSTRCSSAIKDIEGQIPINLLASEEMKAVTPKQLYSQRLGTVEPVFSNIRHNKRLTRLNHRGRAKVNTQWNLYCMVHNIEKLAKTNLGRPRVQ